MLAAASLPSEGKVGEANQGGLPGLGHAGGCFCACSLASRIVVMEYLVVVKPLLSATICLTGYIEAHIQPPAKV